MVALIAEFRDHLPPASNKYHKALTSIILSLNSYIHYNSEQETHWI